MIKQNEAETILEEKGISGLHNKLIFGNSLEILKKFPDKSVDCILTDPPYGVNIDYGGVFDDTQENLKDLINEMMPEFLRVTKKVVAITCGVKNIHKYPEPTYMLCWAGLSSHDLGPWGFCCWQPILVYGKDPYLANRLGSRHDTFITNEGSPKNGHPVPKPIKLWKKVLGRISIDVNDVILDPFIGSGTTAVACQFFNKKFIGIDLNEDYLKITEKGLSQLSLGI